MMTTAPVCLFYQIITATWTFIYLTLARLACRERYLIYEKQANIGQVNATSLSPVGGFPNKSEIFKYFDAPSSRHLFFFSLTFQLHPYVLVPMTCSHSQKRLCLLAGDASAE